MDAFREFLADWVRTVELDPVQHGLTAMLAMFIAFLLALFLWAATRGLI